MKHRVTLGYLLITLLAACNFRVVPTPTATPTAAPPPPARLSVVYLDGSTLYGWQDGDSAPRPLADNALAPVKIAPDGQHVAFARGDNGQPQTLWVVGLNESVQQQLVEIGDLPAQRSASVRIGQVGWLDEATVYFNTVQAYAWGYQPDNNLYRAHIGTATEPASSRPALILPRGAGGQFAISPDRQHIAVVYPGQYDNERGRIHVIDPLGEQVTSAFEFTAVSTASEVPFYPPLSWMADSGGVRIPLPSRDLVYEQAAAPPVPLWLLPVTGEPRITGYVPAPASAASVAANGLPRWSDLTGTMLYFQRSATADALYDLFLADADGGSPQRYADGSVEILDARWIPGAGRFVYMRGTSLMLGQRGMNPQVLADRVQSWILVGSDVVYTITAAGMLELRALHVDSPGTSVLIATLAEPPVADAAFSR